MKDSHVKTEDIASIALFVSFMAICSWISVPATIPFTLQTFGAFLTVGLLGGKRGTLAVAVYLILGAAGLPVFSGFSGGIGYLLGPTGGFLLGFLFTALIMWGLESLLGVSKWSYMISMFLGLTVCYSFGTIWFLTVYMSRNESITLITALKYCVLPFIIPDAIKIMLANSICYRLRSIRASMSSQ